MQKGKFKLDSYPSFIAAVRQKKETKEELFSGTLHYRYCHSLDRAGKNILSSKPCIVFTSMASIGDSWYLFMCVSCHISFFWRIMPFPTSGPIWYGKEDSIPLIQQRNTCWTTPSFVQRDQLRDGHMMSAGQLALTLRTFAETLRK